MVLLGLVATIIALLEIQSVFELVLYAWAGLAASFGPLLMMLLYTDKVTKAGALWSIFTGTAVTIIWINTPWIDYLYELVPAAIASTLVLKIGRASCREREEVNKMGRSL